jgi:hypothetical protein
VNRAWQILRVFLISGVVIAIFALGIKILSHLAADPAPQTGALPLWNLRPLVFASGFDEKAPYSPEALAEVISLKEQVIPVLEVRPTRDGEWVIFGRQSLELGTSGKAPVERYTLAELAQKGLVPLKEFVTKHHPPHLMVVVHSAEVAAASSVINALGERTEPFSTFIFSPNHRLNRELRILKPEWWVGGDNSQLTQWYIFSALGVVTLAEKNFDWILTGGIYGSPKSLAPNITDELQRRKIGNILAMNDEETEFPPNVEVSSLYGILTKRPIRFLELLGRRRTQVKSN